ncbi:MAG: DUF4249 family protein [Bacteroidota bacterium]
MSCRDDFAVDFDESVDNSLNVNAQLVAQRPISASILKTVGFNVDIAEATVTDAEVMFTGSNVAQGELAMYYDPSTNEYTIDRSEAILLEGHDYTLTIEDKENPNESITATTRIPFAVRAKDWSLFEQTYVIAADGSRYWESELSVSLNTPKELPAYYHIIPYRGITVEQRDNQGQVILTDLDGRLELEVVQVLSDRAGVFEFEHQLGVYADQSRLSDDEISIKVRTSEPLREGEIVRRLEVDIFTLSEELYRYDENIHLHLINVAGNYSSSLPTYTNVTNGLGVVGGCSLSTLLIP